MDVARILLHTCIHVLTETVINGLWMLCPPDCFYVLADLNNHALKVSGKLCSGCAFLSVCYIIISDVKNKPYL